MRSLRLWTNALALLLLVLTFVNVQGVEAQEPVQGRGGVPALVSPVTIQSPLNMSYDYNSLILNVTFKIMLSPDSASLTYSLDGQDERPIALNATFNPLIATATYANGTVANVTSVFSYYNMSGIAILPPLDLGSHSLSVLARYNQGSMYGTDNATVLFTVNGTSSLPVRKLDLVFPTEILSPSNTTCCSKLLELNVTSQLLFEPESLNITWTYSLDAAEKTPIPWAEVWEDRPVTITYSNGSTKVVQGEPPFVPDRISGYVVLPELSEGPHNLTVYKTYEYNNGAAIFRGSDNRTVFFIINDGKAPGIKNLLLEGKKYSQTVVPLNFSTDQLTSWIGYSLDGVANVTITQNSTLTGLTEGSHTLIVYANDTAGNMASKAVAFEVSLAPSRATPSATVPPVTTVEPTATPSAEEPTATPSRSKQSNQVDGALIVITAAITAVAAAAVLLKTRQSASAKIPVLP